MSIVIPGFWRNNIRKLEEIVSGSSCYIDVVNGADQYSVYLSDVPWGSEDYNDSRLAMYRLTKTSMHTLKDQPSLSIDDFWEAMTIAAMMTVFGVEVHLGSNIRHPEIAETVSFDDIEEIDGKMRRKASTNYELFSSKLEDHIVFYQNNDEDIEDITGGDFIGEQAPLRSRRIDHRGKMSVEEFLD